MSEDELGLGYHGNLLAAEGPSPMTKCTFTTATLKNRLRAINHTVFLLQAINVLSSQDVGSSGDYQSDCSRYPYDLWRRRPRQRRSTPLMFGGRKPLDSSKAFKVSSLR